MQIQPMGKYVLVELVKPDTGNLVLPDGNGKLAQSGDLRILKVIAVGDGRLMQGGERVPLGLEPNDEVLVLPDTQLITPNAQMYDCENQAIINADFIVGVVKNRGAFVPRKLLVAAGGKVN